MDTQDPSGAFIQSLQAQGRTLRRGDSASRELTNASLNRITRQKDINDARRTLEDRSLAMREEIFLA